MNIKTRISKLKSSAKARNIKLKLMDYEYENLLKLGCHYCGKNVLEENGTCLDRVDSNSGYVLHNVVPCCKICNRAKSDMDFVNFIDWVKKAYLFQQNIIETLSKLDNREYNYKKEKDLHKQSKNDTSYLIKKINH